MINPGKKISFGIYTCSWLPPEKALRVKHLINDRLNMVNVCENINEVGHWETSTISLIKALEELEFIKSGKEACTAVHMVGKYVRERMSRNEESCHFHIHVDIGMFERSCNGRRAGDSDTESGD